MTRGQHHEAARRLGLQSYQDSEPTRHYAVRVNSLAFKRFDDKQRVAILDQALDSLVIFDSDSYRLRICFYWPRTLCRRLHSDHKGVADKATQWSFKIHENSDRGEESHYRIDNGT
jgi:hypothetical protein